MICWAWICALVALQDASSIEARLDALSAGDPARVSSAWNDLAREGDAAVRAAFASFAEHTVAERRARARFAASAIDVANYSAFLPFLADPDAWVRRALLEALADPRLRGAEVARDCTRAFGERAQLDPDPSLRALCIRSLGAQDDDAAAALLERELVEAQPAERLLAARELGSRPRLRSRLVARVQADVAGKGSDSDEVLAALLDTGYGPALAEMPNGGAHEADLAPFVVGERHPSSAVREAAANALDAFVSRLRFLGDVDRAERAMLALLDRGLDDPNLLLAAARTALFAAKDPSQALVPARELVRRLGSSTEVEHRRALAGALILEGAAEIASEHPERSGAAFDRAAAVLDGVIGDALDRFEPALAPLQAQSVETRALIDLWRAFAQLALGAQSSDEKVLDAVRRAHRGSLLVQATIARGRSRGFQDRMPGADDSSEARAALGTGSLDDLFNHRLSPVALILDNDRGGGLARERRLELTRALCSALAAVAPGEMSGFSGPNVRNNQLRDWTADPERGLIFDEVRAGVAAEIERRIRASSNDLQRLPKEVPERDPRRARLVERLTKDQNDLTLLAAQWPRLLSNSRIPSEFALAFAAQLREDGRSADALALAESMQRDLESWDRRQTPYGESLIARIEETLGTSYTDEGDGAKADEVLNVALKRFQGLEQTAKTYSLGAEFIAAMRRSQANVLTSLAVNANVKLAKPELALEYFERSLALDKNEFSDVLLACYRARVGRATEARALLSGIAIAPAHYYNLACTYALLGEKETALDFLRREFAENELSQGARTRQKSWAKTDPDLASLRGDPRFDELLR